MGFDINEFCENGSADFETFLSEPRGAKSNIIGFAMVDYGALAAAGVTEQLIIDGTLAADAVIGKVRDLQLAGKAVLFPDRTINGKMPMPEELKYPSAFGSEAEPRTTGEVKMMLDLTYSHFYSTQNVMAFNDLRANRRKYELVYWTKDSVHIVVNKKVVFQKIGYQIEGDVSKVITGDFSAIYYNEHGQDIPYGPIDYGKLEGYTKLNITAPATNVGLTVITCANRCLKSYKTSAAGPFNGTLQFQVAETVGCLEWTAYKDCDGTLPTSVVINGTTGLMTFTGLAVGKHKFTIVANAGYITGVTCIDVEVI
jgi:hypothetical protein